MTAAQVRTGYGLRRKSSRKLLVSLLEERVTDTVFERIISNQGNRAFLGLGPVR
jgi:hypothetical protein